MILFKSCLSYFTWSRISFNKEKGGKNPTCLTCIYIREVVFSIMFEANKLYINALQQNLVVKLTFLFITITIINNNHMYINTYVSCPQ